MGTAPTYSFVRNRTLSHPSFRLLTNSLFASALGYLFARGANKGKGDVSSFAALCTALAATIGTGNIVGVATAVQAGGPGAIFLDVVVALLGMATKYAECLLAVKYRGTR